MLTTLTRRGLMASLLLPFLLFRSCVFGETDPEKIELGRTPELSLQSNVDLLTELGNNNQHVTACNDEYIYYADGGEAIVRLDRESGAELARLPVRGVRDIASWGDYLIAVGQPSDIPRSYQDRYYLLFPAAFTAEDVPVMRFDIDALRREEGMETAYGMPYYKPAFSLFCTENVGEDFETLCMNCLWDEFGEAEAATAADGMLTAEGKLVDETNNLWRFCLSGEFARLENMRTYASQLQYSALYVRDGSLLRMGWSWSMFDGEPGRKIWPFLYRDMLCGFFGLMRQEQSGTIVGGLTIGDTGMDIQHYHDDIRLLHRWSIDQKNGMLYLIYVDEPQPQGVYTGFVSGPPPVDMAYPRYDMAQAEGCMVTCVDLNQKHVAGSLELPYVGEAVFHADETGVYSFRAGDGRIRCTLWDGTSFLSGEQVEYESTTCEYGHTHAELYVEVSGGYAFFFHEDTMGVERELENMRNISFIKAVKLG